MRLPNWRPVILVVLSLAILCSVPGLKGTSSLENLFPPSFEVNGMAVSPQGDVAAGSFYALDPTVIPWDLTNPIYKYVGVTLIVSNFNSSSSSGSTGINLTSTDSLAPYRVILVIEGVQRNTLSIVSDIQSVFSMQPGSFQALISNPLTLPVSVFGANLTYNPYSNFVNRFISTTSNKAAMIGKYTSLLLQTSSSAIIFNSIESLTYPISPVFSASSIASQVLNIGSIGAAIAPAFGLNSTGVVVLHKKFLTFTLPQDYTIGFGSLVGITGGIYSTTNETFAASMPSGAQIKSFSPVNMLVQSSTGSTLVIGEFPWVGTAQRLLPDVTVTFHYPAFDSPYLSATWAAIPSTFNVGKPFNLTIGITNTGAMDASNLHFNLAFTGVVLLGQQSITSIQFNVASLLKGATINRMYNFQSYNSNAQFTLSADFLDSSNYVYQWSTQYSPSPTIRQNGGLTVTKSVSPNNPSYGAIGNVTVTIHNNNLTATYFNIEDLNPDAQIFLYPQGAGSTPAQPRPCLSLVGSYNTVVANMTHFTFQVQDGQGCASTVLTRVLLQRFGQPYQLVSSPNMLLGGGETWSPLKPYLIPGGPAGLYESLNLRLTFQSAANVTGFGTVYPGLLPQLENPRTSYLGLYCAPCSIPRGGSTTITGALVNATGKPLAASAVVLSYKFPNNTVRPITTVVTNATGGFSTNWLGVSTPPLGNYRLIANYTGSVQNNAEGVYLPLYVVTPTSIGPAGTVTLNYPYFFNSTGSILITPERIAYSSQVNATGTGQQLIGEYVAQSTAVPVTVGAPVIVPVTDMTMNTTKISIFYIAQNQSLVQVNLRVTNTGPQLANNIVVSALIPQGSGSNQYKFYYTAPLLEVYPSTKSAPVPQTGLLQAYVTVDPAVVANQTTTTVSIHLYNAANVTYTNIIATVPSFTGSGLNFPILSKTATNMAPGSTQTVNFTATAQVKTIYFNNGVWSDSLSGSVSYNQSSTKNFLTNFRANVPIYDPTIVGFNPSLRVIISPLTNQLSAGATAFLTLTVTNTGTSNITDFSSLVQAYSPLFSPGGPSSPETSYGGYGSSWLYGIGAGQSISFRIGIQTRAGGVYPVFGSYINYFHNPPGSTGSSYGESVSASSAALITAIDTTPPTISTPWSSPFAPTSSEDRKSTR